MNIKKILLLFFFGMISLNVFAEIDPPVAEIYLHKQEFITQGKLKQKIEVMSSQLGVESNPESRKEVLNLLIDELLIDQAAEKEGVNVSDSELQQRIEATKSSLGVQVTDEQFKNVIQQQMGIDYQQFVNLMERRIREEKYVMQQKQSAFDKMREPNPEEVESFYNQNYQQFTNPAMVRFKHIYADIRKVESQSKMNELKTKAQEIRNTIISGNKSFEDLLLRYSQDSASEFNGGDFGYLPKNNTQMIRALGEDFCNTVFKMDEGQVSDVLESSIGIHIVKITDQRKNRILDLNDPITPGSNTTVRSQVRAYLIANQRQQIFKKAVDDVAKELREKADIQIYEERLNW